MSETYYKAVRPDGTDFRTGRIRYDVGTTVTHPKPHKRDASGYLSVATVPTDCTGASWPLRLLEVAADDVWTTPEIRNKRCTHSLTVVREVDAMLALGPQGRAVVALIERCKTLTYGEAKEMAAARAAAGAAARAAAGDAAGDAARDAARDAAWDAAWAAAWDAAGDAAWAAAGDAAWAAAWAAAGDAAWAAAGDAAWAAAWAAAGDAAWAAAGDAAGLLARDLIGDEFTQKQYDLLTGPWRKVIGPLHPDDADLRAPVAAVGSAG